MAPVLIVPGIGGSGPKHWQSRWQALEASFIRVHMPDWDRPERASWVGALAAAVRAVDEPPVIVAHSLGCLAVTHWLSGGGSARAALLVAVPDPQAPVFPDVAKSFGPVPLDVLKAPTQVVASHDDPFASFDFAARCARAWGSSLTDVGAAGHINADSGLGDWPAGRELLRPWLG